MEHQESAEQLALVVFQVLQIYLVLLVPLELRVLLVLQRPLVLQVLVVEQMVLLAQAGALQLQVLLELQGLAEQRVRVAVLLVLLVPLELLAQAVLREHQALLVLVREQVVSAEPLALAEPMVA